MVNRKAAVFSTNEIYSSHLVYESFLLKGHFNPIHKIRDEENIFTVVREQSPGIVAIDYSSCTYKFFKILKRCKEAFPETKFAIFWFNHSDFEKKYLVRYGANAILPIHYSYYQAFMCITVLLKNEYSFNEIFTEKFLRSTMTNVMDSKSELTPLELNCIRYFISGYSETEIARELNMKPASIHNVFSIIHDKTSCRSFPQFFAFADLHNILPVSKVSQAG